MPDLTIKQTRLVYMNTYAIFTKEEVTLAVNVDGGDFLSEKEQLINSGFIMNINKINAESESEALNKSKYSDELEFSKNNIISSVIDRLINK